MRAVVNIFLPRELHRILENEVHKNRYATKSGFFRSLLRMWIEGRLLKELAESRRELESGKGKVLRSLKDLR